MKKYPEVYVITLNWNGKNHTVECVESLKKLNYPNYNIIVVDNASSDGSVDEFKKRFTDITIIENERNLGYADGFNTGLKHAYKKGADYFLILNNDTVIDSNALEELVKIAENDSDIGFVSGKVYFYNRPNAIQTVGKKTHPVAIVMGHIGWGEEDKGQYDKIRECDFIDDVFLLVRREVFEKTQGYDSNFFLYGEETDWCARVRRAGFKIVYTPYAKIWHKGSMSTGGGMNPVHTYYLTRNRIVFVRRNGTSKQFLLYVLMLIVQVPRMVPSYIKHGQLKVLVSHIRGLNSGLLWVLRK